MTPLKLKIDDAFFLSENRDGYMILSEMKQVWAVELDLLHEFAQVCCEYRLKWFAHAGTMLGAIRHHGFIPWDDDIDVTMPRADYEHLCSLAPGVFKHPYFFQTDETDKFFCRNFARLRNSETTAIQSWEKEMHFPFNQGIFIDIFPYDNVSDDDAQLGVEMRQMEKLANEGWQMRNMVHFYHPKNNCGLKKKVSYYLKHMWYKYVDKTEGNYLQILQKHRSLATAHSQEDTRRVGEMIIPPLGRHIWDKAWINKIISVPFEMIQINVPADYNQCLNASFGPDWKTPKQVGNYHGQIIFDANQSYTEYQTKNE